MVGKLSKKDDIFYLFVDASWSIASTDAKDNRVNKLSLKNCQAIERGYDLDELAEDWCMKPEKKWSNNNNEVGDNYGSFKVGFQKALEVNSDKRFTFKEMVDCWNKALNFQEHKETLGDHMQSLRQTEWDVEIVMGDPIGIGDKYTPDTKPKLDADGCLILKRK